MTDRPSTPASGFAHDVEYFRATRRLLRIVHSERQRRSPRFYFRVRLSRKRGVYPAELLGVRSRARFVVRHERALGELFGEVLVLCADAGLATVGVLAIDGTKVAANASRDRTLDYEQIANAIVAEQIATDIAQTQQLGQRRGDQLPDVIAITKGREGRLRAARQRLDQERAERAEPIPRSRAQRLLEGKRRLEEDLAVEREINAK